MFLVDLVHRQITVQEEKETFTPEIVQKITTFIEAAIQLQIQPDRTVIEEILGGSLKLLNLFMPN